MKKNKKHAKIANAAKPFYYKGNRRTVLFIHGFTDSLHRVRRFAKGVNEKQGYTVCGICLSGHGTHPDDLSNYDTSHWRDDCERAVKGLIKDGNDKIDIVGLSFGGLLALEIASKYPENIKSVVCIDSPYRLKFHPGVKLLINIVKPFRKSWKKKSYYRLTKEQRKELKEVGIYDRIPVKNIEEIVRFIEKELDFLPKVKCDILLVQGHNSIIIDKKSAKNIKKEVASKNVEIFYINNYYHSTQISVDQIFEKTMLFLGERR